jgi:hypothetical protein
MDHRIKSGGDESETVAWHSSGAKARRENEILFSPLPTGEREVKARHENGILFVIASATQWSEAIQSKASRWIASSLTLLAMTKQK